MTIISANANDAVLVGKAKIPGHDRGQESANEPSSKGQAAQDQDMPTDTPRFAQLEGTSRPQLPPLDIFPVEPGNKYALGGLALYFTDLKKILGQKFMEPDPSLFDMTDFSEAEGGIFFVAILPRQYAVHTGDESTQPFASYLLPGSVFSDERGVVVGMGAVKSLGAGFAEVKRMWVSTAYRRLGIASRLMQVLEDFAAARDTRPAANGATAMNNSLAREPHHTMRLDTSSDLPTAIALYRKLGYREIEAYNTNEYAGIWFEKELLPRESDGTRLS